MLLSQYEVESVIKASFADVEPDSISHGREDDKFVFNSDKVRFTWNGVEFIVSPKLEVSRVRGRFVESGTPLTKMVETELLKQKTNRSAAPGPPEFNYGFKP